MYRFVFRTITSLLCAVLVTGCATRGPNTPGTPTVEAPAIRGTSGAGEQDPESITHPAVLPAGPTGEAGLTPQPGAAIDLQPLSDAVPQEVLLLVEADLAQRLGRSPASTQVLRAAAVAWPDASLGCPQSGLAYTQAVEQGYHVELLVDGELYDYRIGAGWRLLLCPSAQLDRLQLPSPNDRPGPSPVVK